MLKPIEIINCNFKTIGRQRLKHKDAELPKL